MMLPYYNDMGFFRMFDAKIKSINNKDKISPKSLTYDNGLVDIQRLHDDKKLFAAGQEFSKDPVFEKAPYVAIKWDWDLGSPIHNQGFQSAKYIGLLYIRIIHPNKYDRSHISPYITAIMEAFRDMPGMIDPSPDYDGCPVSAKVYDAPEVDPYGAFFDNKTLSQVRIKIPFMTQVSTMSKG